MSKMPVNKSMTFSKLKFGLFLIIVLLGIITIGIGYYSHLFKSKQTASQNKNSSVIINQNIQPPVYPTLTTSFCKTINGWQMYTSYNHQYQICIPSNYSISYAGITPDRQYIVDIDSPLDPNRDKHMLEPDNGELKIEIYIQKYSKSLDEYIASQRIGIDTPPDTIFQKTIINGIPSVYSNTHSSVGAETYYFIKNGYLITINKYPFTTSRQNEYKTILSTFGFYRK